MFSLSARRVCLLASSTPAVASFSSTAPRAAASQALSYRSHQRRYSSSKPSSPADGTKGVAPGQTVPAAQPQKKSSNAKKADRPDAAQVEATNVEGQNTDAAHKSPKTTKRKSKNANSSAHAKGKNQDISSLPAVPSISHIVGTKLATADFFALHRPMSTTMSIPRPVTEAEFASIFEVRPKLGSANVISTLSTTLENLEMIESANAAERRKQFSLGPQQAHWNSETDELRDAIHAVSGNSSHTKHLDPPQAPQAFDDFAQNFIHAAYRPFQPPPAPEPVIIEEPAIRADNAGEISQYRRYTTVLTIDEATDSNGEVTYAAHSTPLQEDVQMPMRFLDRMAIRQERSRERAEERAMYALSVKRQRKLKMKKHKYKKLMRRTRNLRRRLDRN